MHPKTIQALTQMLAELESSPLVTILAPCRRPANEGACIRVNMSQPPQWYRKLCANYPSSRGVRKGKFDTKIKRANVIQLLNTLLTRGSSRSKYAGEVMGVASKISP